MWPTTITGEPLPSDAPTPETRRPQQLTVTNSELPASHLPSAPRRRELLARRNFITCWSPTVRRIGSLTMLPTTVSGVSNIAHSFHRATAPHRRLLPPVSTIGPTTSDGPTRRGRTLWIETRRWIDS